MASKRLHWFLALAWAGWLICWSAAPALADSIHLSYRGQEGISYTVGSQSQSPSTAEFFTTTPYHGQDWIGYCMDPTQNFRSPLEVVTPEAWLGPAVGSTNWLEAAWLMEHFAPGFDWLGNHASVNYGSHAVIDRIQAVQLAIWEVIVDPSATYGLASLSQGGFRTSSGHNLTLAGQYLSALSQSKQTGGGMVTLSGSNVFMVGQSSTYQDILVGATATPEPASLILAASGLGLLALRKRRRGAAAQA